MTKRRVLLLTVALAGGCLLLGLFLVPAGGPHYKGLPANYWRRIIKDTSTSYPSSLLSRVKRVFGLVDYNGTPSISAGDPGATAMLLYLHKDEDPGVRMFAGRPGVRHASDSLLQSEQARGLVSLAPSYR